MSTRKEQIEAFKKAHMKHEGTPSVRMECSRVEFLAYAFIRGRYYQQQERTTRPFEEAGEFPLTGLLGAIRSNFPVADMVPVTVPPEEERIPRNYPWPDVDYKELKKQIQEWLRTEAPDHLAWLEHQEELTHLRNVALKAQRGEWERKRAKETGEAGI
ncbi:MAG: hypothetical protein DRQ89_14970 [Epsilonproteobacteria bacterium]|nr:MAG: hypothetical protein DRQ89_14970 [Campylobacterota bacterium]